MEERGADAVDKPFVERQEVAGVLVEVGNAGPFAQLPGGGVDQDGVARRYELREHEQQRGHESDDHQHEDAVTAHARPTPLAELPLALPEP